MTIHEFGAENKNVIVLIHPSLVMWDYFEHGGLAALQPKRLMHGLERVMDGGK